MRSAATIAAAHRNVTGYWPTFEVTRKSCGLTIGNEERHSCSVIASTATAQRRQSDRNEELLRWIVGYSYKAGMPLLRSSSANGYGRSHRQLGAVLNTDADRLGCPRTTEPRACQNCLS